VPHALLERLLSTEPLVSAVVRRERLATDRLFDGLSSVVASSSAASWPSSSCRGSSWPPRWRMAAASISM